MGKALKEFVEKDEKDAIKEFVKWELRKVQNELFKRNAEDDNIVDLLEERKKQTGHNEEEDEEIEKVFNLLEITISITSLSFIILFPFALNLFLIEDTLILTYFFVICIYDFQYT